MTPAGLDKHTMSWSVLCAFVAGEYALPEAETRLQEILGQSCTYDKWKPAFDAVFNAKQLRH